MRDLGVAMLVILDAGCSFTPGTFGDQDANGTDVDGTDVNVADAAVRPYRTCAEALAAGITTSGVLEIDPDGDAGRLPFTAYCDMTTAGGGWTLVWVYRFTSRLTARAP